MSLKLPAVNADQSVQYALDLITRSFPDFGGRNVRLRFGSSSVVFTASSRSAAKVVAHGLGVAPQTVFLTSAPSFVLNVVYAVTAVDATNITFDGFNSGGGSVTNTQNCYWLALG